jgi:hypothetical protein
MKRIRALGLLCVVAVFAASALVASAASAALPEYKTCIKAVPKGSGKFADKSCSVPSGAGKYELAEWNQGKSISFTGKSKNPVNSTVNPFTHTVESSVTCKTEAVAGKLTGPKTAEIQSTWKKCHIVSPNVACNTKGHGAGEIVGEKLAEELVYLDAAKTKVGNRIKATGSKLAEYECAGGAVKITATGEVIGEDQGNVNTFSKKSKTVLGFGGGGDNLQAFAYNEEKGNEANEQGFIEWASSVDMEGGGPTEPDVDPNKTEFEACVGEGLTPMPSGDGNGSFAEAAGICIGAFGPNDDSDESPGASKLYGYPGQLSGVPLPAFILSQALGAGPGKEAPAPATQIGTTENKGQTMEVKA